MPTARRGRRHTDRAGGRESRGRPAWICRAGPGCSLNSRTIVHILRGRYRGRRGWVAGLLEDRTGRGLTKALVHIDGAEPELLAIASLAPADQAELPLTSQTTGSGQLIEKPQKFANCGMVGHGEGMPQRTYQAGDVVFVRATVLEACDDYFKLRIEDF